MTRHTTLTRRGTKWQTELDLTIRVIDLGTQIKQLGLEAIIYHIVSIVTQVTMITIDEDIMYPISCEHRMHPWLFGILHNGLTLALLSQSH